MCWARRWQWNRADGAVVLSQSSVRRGISSTTISTRTWATFPPRGDNGCVRTAFEDLLSSWARPGRDLVFCQRQTDKYLLRSAESACNLESLDCAMCNSSSPVAVLRARELGRVHKKGRVQTAPHSRRQLANIFALDSRTIRRMTENNVLKLYPRREIIKSILRQSNAACKNYSDVRLCSYWWDRPIESIWAG